MTGVQTCALPICLTTAVGLTSACADFFHTLWPRLSYKGLVIGMSLLCALIANVGLSALISLSIPVLAALIRMGKIMSIYPGIAAMAFAGVVVVTMIAAMLFDPRLIWDRAMTK